MAVASLPATNEGAVTETSLIARTQGKTLDCLFSFPLPRVAGWLFNVSLPSVQQGCCGSGGRWSAPGGALTPR